jgi:hypothetical protein
MVASLLSRLCIVKGCEDLELLAVYAMSIDKLRPFTGGGKVKVQTKLGNCSLQSSDALDCALV